jgi:Predicted transcriptional regulators
MEIKNPDYNLIARQIHKKRAEKGITQEELAGLAGLVVPTISNIETRKKRPTLTSVYRIAQALNTTLESLVDGDPSPTPMTDAFIRLLSDCNNTEEQFIFAVAELLEKLLHDNRCCKC